MPNYGLVINSRFRPFSYAEMLAPVQQQTEAHQALEEAYGALGTQAGTIESMLNRELDRDAYNQYQGYMKGLQEQADILAKEGLSPSVRNSLMNMRQRYGQEIIPIQKAAERREKLAEEQRKLGNSMIFDIDAANTGLNAFMENPSLNYRSIDRKDLYSRAVNDFGQLANDLASYGKGQAVDRFTNTFITDYGITRTQAAEFADAIRNGNIDNTNPVLRAIYNNLYNSTGVNGWNNADAERAVQNTILEGVAAAIGKSTVSPMTNQEAVENARYQRELALLQERARIAGQQGNGKGNNGSGDLRFKTRNIRTSDYDTRAPGMISTLDNLIVNIERTNQAVASGNTMRRGTMMQHMVNQTPNSSSGYNSRDFESLRREFDANGVRYSVQDRGNGTRAFVFEDINDLRNLRNYYADRNQYDTYRASQYYRVIDPSQYTGVSAILSGLSTDNSLPNYAVGYGDNGFGLVKGDNINFTDDSKVSYAEVVTDAGGMDYLFAKVDGQDVIIPMVDIDPTWRSQSDAVRTSLQRYQEAINNGYTTIELDNGTTIPIADRIDAIINDKLNAMQLSALQTSKTESQTVKD